MSGASEVRGKGWGEAAEAAIWLAFALGAWLYTYPFEHELRSYALGTVSWPRAIIVVIAICAVGQLADALRNGRSPAEAMKEPEEDASGERQLSRRLRVIAIFGLPLLYVWFLPRTGYILTTPVFIAVYAVLFGQRRLRNIVALALGVWVLTLIVFLKFLFVPLPRGNWAGFYELSGWVVSFLRNL